MSSTPYIDLTSLNINDDQEKIICLCQQAKMASAEVAAVCLYPQWIKLAKQALKNTPIKVATVINFPTGTQSLKACQTQIQQALQADVDELDIVMPYQWLIAADESAVSAFLNACRVASQNAVMKVILETGALTPLQITRAAELAIDNGADFIKTSTGKINIGATLAAVQAMIRVIQAKNPRVGIKISGGVRTLGQVAEYRDAIAVVMGEAWLQPATFRVGASCLPT